jgi:hypothetical protein
MSDELTDEEMSRTIDFSNGVRGKHYRNYRAGHTVTIYNGDEVVEQRVVEPIDGGVVIDPDLRADFPDSESVNRALRAYRAAS